MNEHLIVILDKMHEVIGAEWDKELITFDYSKHLWSGETEKLYTEWLTRYLISNSGARRELMSTPSKYLSKDFARGFVFNYGWKNE